MLRAMGTASVNVEAMETTAVNVEDYRDNCNKC